MTETARPRILVLAEAANPEWTSVPLIGWSLSRALAEVADVHLVTQVRNREAILRAGLVEGRDFTAIDTEAWTRPVWRLGEALSGGANRGWTIKAVLNRLSYPVFERMAWTRFGPEIRAGRWDVVHRITPVSPAVTSPIAAKVARAGVPFVLGPLNGGVPWPPGFEAERRAEGEKLAGLRGVYRHLPGRHRMLDAATVILAATEIAAAELPGRVAGKVIRMPENAVDPARFAKIATQDPKGPLRAVFIGRLVPLKGVDMAIAAARDLLAEGRMTFDILGDGPERARLEALADGLPGITFHGQVPHERVQDLLAAAHVMVFPSIREFGGGVVLEAMATGVVPMVVDYAGPGELVDPAWGIAVPLGSRDAIAAGFRAALERLAEDRTSLPAMAAAGRARVASHFTWPARARQIAAVYDLALGRTAAKPRFFDSPGAASRAPAAAAG